MAHPLLNPGRMISVIDFQWRIATLPFENIRVPLDELPDPDSENGPQETLKELEKKWTDLGLQRFAAGPGALTTPAKQEQNQPRQLF